MKFNTGDKFVIQFSLTHEIYNGFMALFNDKNPLHTDRQFALERGFDDVVMHGNVLNGFISYFVGECLPVKNVVIHSQTIQFKNPVYLNDNLQFRAEITDIHESVNVVDFSYSFKKNTGTVVAKGKIQIGLLK
jgi:3-hydroxybutyryl-CoA dehydratase